MTDRIVPLVAMLFPNVVLYYSTIDINVKNFMLNPFGDLPNDEHKYQAFKPYILNDPTVTLEFDIFNPRFSYSTINIELSNRDNLHDYSIMFPLETCNIIYAEYDYINEVERFRLIGKISDIEFNRGKINFTVKDIGESIFIDQPINVLAEDTFQTVHTFGPFDTKPLSIFGLIVDIYNPSVGGSVATVQSNTWPVAPAGNDLVRTLVAFIEHESLYYDKDDLFWVGALASVIEDPLPTNEFKVRSSGVGNPYTGWPSGDQGAKSDFCLGASAYILRAGDLIGATDKNAKFDSGSKRGRIWFDVAGPELGANWLLANATRRIDTSGVLNNPRQYWDQRTVGAIAMGNLAQRHIIRIWRRCLPENVDSVGQAFPVVYGNAKKVKAIHAIGGKAVGDGAGAGNDYYIFCCHPMAFRIVINKNSVGTLNDSWLNDTIQFAEAKLWHGLDQFVEESLKANLPYIRNANEYGSQSNNPFPRFISNYFSWNAGAGPGMIASSQLEPSVMWFNADEKQGTRYQDWTVGKNRQIELIDNKALGKYSGVGVIGSM